MCRSLDKALKVARQTDAKARAKRAARLNQQESERDHEPDGFAVNQPVYYVPDCVKEPEDMTDATRRTRKLADPVLLGPARVVERTGPVNFRIRDIELGEEKVVNMDQLVKIHQAVSLAFPDVVPPSPSEMVLEDEDSVYELDSDDSEEEDLGNGSEEWRPPQKVGGSAARSRPLVVVEERGKCDGVAARHDRRFRATPERRSRRAQARRLRRQRRRGEQA